nr:hypothetical protein [Tanacetum cinerariifolium]
MVVILEKSEHNVNFHPIVDFIEASPLRIKTTAEGTQILATVDEVLRTVTESSLRRNLKLQDKEGISSLPDTELFENLTLMGYNISPNQKFTFQKGTPTEPYHTPSQEAQPSSPTHISTSYIPTVIPIPTVTQSEPTPLRQYTRRVRIAQSSTLLPVADEPASPMRDVNEGEACTTDSGFIADQDRATIAKSSTLPHDTALRVTSPAAVEGSMQQTINELTALCTSLQRQQSELLVQFQAQKLEINKLNARVKILEENQKVIGARSTNDAPIKGRRIDEEEATVLAGGIDVPTGSYSISIAGLKVVDIHTGSDVVPTASPIVATATVVTPYSRRKGKEVMVESDTLKKQRDAEVARIHAEEELQGMIDSLDRTNETIAKYLNNLGWKVKDFKGMTFEEIEAKFVAVWKLVKDFIPMGSKEEAERLKRKGFNLEQEKAKKQKTSEEVPDKEKSPEEIPEEKVKEMMQLVPIEEVYVSALQVKHHIIDWKVHIEGQRSYWKIIRSIAKAKGHSAIRKCSIGTGESGLFLVGWVN